MTLRTRDVAVRGGELRVGEWGRDDGPVVVAIHGITASHLAWAAVADALPEVHLVAPDLRGRGASSDLPGPFGMTQHAEDMAAVLDALAVPDPLIVGHSMGAFVALVTAQRTKASRAPLLVDGGLPLELPPGYRPEDAERLLGPAAARLAMNFESRQDYREFWKQHPALGTDWSAAVEAYVDYDLAGVAPRLRSRTSAAAMVADSVQLYGDEAVSAALDAFADRSTLLTAPRGLQDAEPLYSAAALDRWRRRFPGLVVEEVPGVNHYTVVMSPRGARAVAGHIRRLL
ncbi:hypothetical protein BH11ACT4_BH11ACT4_16430 [soil metagenome]